MKPTVCGAALMLATVSSFVVPSAAKGPTIRLVISGPLLEQPLEVTDPAALAHVWSTAFLGGPAAEPRQSLPRYAVSFYVQPPRSEVRMMYVVHYVVDPDTGRSYVYLPGRGEEWYRLNASTIYREKHDGRWFEADPAWSAAVRARLTTATGSSDNR
jgi:hypothetical protein